MQFNITGRKAPDVAAGVKNFCNLLRTSHEVRLPLTIFLIKLSLVWSHHTLREHVDTWR